jgi:hypothetical protein
MPDYWIEPISKEKASASKEIPALPFEWVETSAPQIPVSLPIPTLLKVTKEAIMVHAERGDGGYLPAEEWDFHFRKEDIVCVDIFLMPPIPDGMHMQHVTTEDYSRAVIHHRDPFEVVESFASTFTADQHYWLRALAKALKDRLGVKQTFEEIRSAN